MSAARAAIGAAWLVGARLLARVIDLGALLVLARLLLPADFGLVALAMTMIMVVEALLELPLAQVLVRQPELRAAHLDTAFTLGVLRGLALAAIFALLAWPASRFYAEPRLVPLVLALSLSPMARSVASPRMALFFRDIRFHQEFAIGTVAKLIAVAVSAGVAVATGSYWALVAGTLVAPVTATIGSYVVAPYRPRLSLAEWRTFADFLGWTSAAQLVTAINWQSDRLLLGRFVSRAALGQFAMASDLASLSEQGMLKPVERPLMASFARIADDPVRLAAAYERCVVILVTLGLPVMLGLSLYARPAILLALGRGWLPAVPILQLLALAPIPALFVTPVAPLAMATGQTRILARQSLAELAMKLPLLIAAVVRFGIMGAVAVRLVVALGTMLVAASYARSLTGLTVTRQLTAPARAIGAGASMVAATVPMLGRLDGIDGLRLAVGLGTCGAASLGCYVAVLALLWRIAGRPAGPEAIAVDRLARIVARVLPRPRMPMETRA